MAVYTELSKPFLKELADDYGLGRVTSATGIPEGSVNTNYVLEAAKGKFLLRIDEVKSENELKREIDLLSFLRKHAFPCPHPMQDRMGRFYRNFNNRCVSLFKYQEGKVLVPARLKPSQLETIGHALGDLHVIGKAYKKGIDNRFSFERIADLYLSVRNRLPNYFRKICRTLDDEVEYLTRYLEGKLPKGVIHGDIFSDNLLTDGRSWPWPRPCTSRTTPRPTTSAATGPARLPGLLLIPVVIAGFIRLWRTPELRFIAVATTLIVVYVLAWVPGKAYYTDGTAPAVLAAGSLAAERWIARGRRPGLRR